MIKIKYIFMVGFILLAGCVEPPGSKLNTTEKNAFLFSFLSRVGIEESIVDVTPERILVRYELPENVSIEASWFAIMGSALAVDPKVPYIVMQTYSGYVFLNELKVDTSDARALIDEDMTAEEFLSKYS